MSAWKEVELGELIKFGNGKKKPLSEGNIPIYGGNGILGHSGESNYQDETVVIGRVGAYCGSVYYENCPIWVSDNALAAKAKNGYSTKFLYYFLKNANLNQHAGGSSHPLVTQTLLNSLEYNICIDKSEQKVIAFILSSLDDKIDLLHRQNQTLEEMAETLFRQWFVEEADENWKEGVLGDFGKVTTGKTPSKNTPDYWGDFIPFVTPTDYKNFGAFSSKTQRFISKLGAEKMGKNLLPTGAIMATCIGSDMGKVCISNEPCISNQQINSLVLNEDICQGYVFFYLKSQYQTLRNMAFGGTTMPIINKSDFSKIETPIPPKTKIEIFNIHWSGISSKILMNQNQICTLTALRDTLLPKLMSGEVRVETQNEKINV